MSLATVGALSKIQTRAHDAVIGMRMNWRMGIPPGRDSRVPG